jgi:uncharacterized protein/peptidoglycan hydrolase-like protein with peptidoglycan-binding domain
MRFCFALAVTASVMLQAYGADAQSPAYYCEPLRAYYPAVPTCPGPWRSINQATPTPAPSFTTQARPNQPRVPAGFAPQDDGLDEFCKLATSSRSIALCSDRELRTLAVERQHAFDAAKGPLNPEQQRALLADQSDWVNSYAEKCGLSQDVPPMLPLARAIKDCMARAGRERTEYLQAYRPVKTAPKPSSVVANWMPGPRIGPSFDCEKAATPLGLLICGSPNLARIDLRLNQAYFALRQQLEPAEQRQLQREDVEFINTVRDTCGVPDQGPAKGSDDCVGAEYEQQRSRWLARLTGSALQEAQRPIEQHIALQTQLQKLGFLPTSTKIDGIYGAATRAAISAWQSESGRPKTGYISDDDAAALSQAQGAKIAIAPPVTEPARTESVPSPSVGEKPAASVPSAVPAPPNASSPAVTEKPAGTTPPAVVAPQSSPAERPRAAAPVASGSAPAVAPARNSSPNPAAADSGPFGAVVFFVLILLAVIGLVVFVKILRRRNEQRITEKILGLAKAAIDQHMRALARKRFQTLRHDDYGNLLVEPWHKEINYFAEKVIDPTMVRLYPEEFDRYRTLRPTLFLWIDQMVDQHSGSFNSITLGPNLTPTDFENYCAEQLRSAGWSADTTNASGDQGTDIIAEKGDIRLVVQCKLYNHPVGNKAVQEIAAARTHEKADWAVVVSNNRYTPSAQELATTNNVLLLHHSDLRNIDELLEV